MTAPGTPATRRLRPVAAVVALVLLPLAGCGDQQDQYCSAVSDHQRELTDLTTGGDSDALIRALPIFEDLQSKAPGDITDDWQQLVSRVKALDAALRAAGVDPADYDRAHPPAGLDAEERTRIDAAARELGSGTTVAALQALDQEARDVCHTPLTM
ncbi:hypothetical protein [Nocardioides panaciterrulae]|uniref:Uncharacterized protein n=1 Tax=Nocardioides panaciterrulae TaxID=661492 RepID=A0A7Y9JB58_9ACTN|nr:hypothetical protein [Nocardioides panaciterrulae]NYD42053.1 hypothetical protein [Nocardioides panaciterrulae]